MEKRVREKDTSAPKVPKNDSSVKAQKKGHSCH